MSMKLQRNKFDKLIFDMDGVITSEYIYWDTAALTVYELVYSWKYYGRQEIDPGNGVIKMYGCSLIPFSAAAGRSGR